MIPILKSADAAQALRTWLDLPDREVPVTRRVQYRALTEDSNLLDRIAHEDFWTGLPALLKKHFDFAWNGIYTLGESGDLLLTAAAGPPVCGQLPPGDGLHRAGMCHDALLQGRAILAHEAKRWPGYVTCDGESGLQTVAGLVIPIRNADGAALGVWDVDATSKLESADLSFFDLLFAVLGRCAAPTKRRLGLWE